MSKKINIFLSILLGAVLVFGNLSCEKKLFNYRNKYCGDWEFEVVSVTYNEQDSTSSTSTETYNGEIKYGEESNELLVTYLDNRSITIVVNKEGEISGSFSLDGSFESKKEVDFRFRTGTGFAGVNYTVVGDKD